MFTRFVPATRLLLAIALGLGLACGSAPGPAPLASDTSAPASPSPASSENEPQPEPSVVVNTAWKSSAADYLDARVEQWLSDPPPVANVKCAMSCHTSFPAVLAHPSLPADRTAHIREARARFEARLPSAGAATPFYGKANNAKVRESHATEAVLVATAFVMDDLARGKPIGAPAKEALERMWSQQAADGAWPWLDFGLEPWEHEDAFGVALAALAAGRIPADTTPGQTEGIRKLRAYVKANVERVPLHDQSALLWSSSALEDLLTSAQAADIAAALRTTQRSNGSFAIAQLMPGHAGTSEHGDGYATALATLALCTTGLEPEAAKNGLAWLQTNQQADGSWRGQSLNGRPGARPAQYMTDASTGYAVLALQTCAN